MRITPQTTTAAIAILLSFPAGIGLAADAGAATPREASSAATAPDIGAGVFGGFTSKGGPVVVELARNGKRVKRVVAAIELKCTPSGDFFTTLDKWIQLPIRGSRFSSTSTDASVEAGQVYEWSDSLKGKLNRKRTRISGSWRNRLVVRNSAGATIDTCDSGPLRFTARR